MCKYTCTIQALTSPVPCCCRGKSKWRLPCSARRGYYSLCAGKTFSSVYHYLGLIVYSQQLYTSLTLPPLQSWKHKVSSDPQKLAIRFFDYFHSWICYKITSANQHTASAREVWQTQKKLTKHNGHCRPQPKPKYFYFVLLFERRRPHGGNDKLKSFC